MRLLVSAAALLCTASTGLAQPKAGQVQPDSLPLGTVYTGAIAEASFMVFEPGNDPGIKMEVTVPRFAKLLRTGTHHQQFGPGNDFVCGTVEFAIDTAAAADLKGEVVVTLGTTTVKVPVTAAVKQRRAGRARLLVVGTPFERFSTGDGKHYAAWTELVDQAGLDVSYLLVNRGKAVVRDIDLSPYQCVLMTAEGLHGQTPEDVRRVRADAEGGGRVVVTANAFFRGTVEKANAILDGYGARMKDEESRNGPNDVLIEKAGLAPEVVRAGVGSARFFRASPVEVTNPRTGRVLAIADGVGEPGDGFVVATKAGRGEVLAIGQSLWWNWISKERADGTDTARFFRWILTPPRDA